MVTIYEVQKSYVMSCMRVIMQHSNILTAGCFDSILGLLCIIYSLVL